MYLNYCLCSTVRLCGSRLNKLKLTNTLTLGYILLHCDEIMAIQRYYEIEYKNILTKLLTT